MSVHPMRRIRRSLAVFLACLLPALPVLAVGIGEISVKSQLGEPLQASIPLGHLGSLSAEQLIVGMADRSHFERIGIDRTGFHSNMKFMVHSDDKGNVWVDIASRRPVKEPYLDFVIEVRWPTGSMYKEFTVLFDVPQ